MEDELLELLHAPLPIVPAVPVATGGSVLWPQCKCGNFLNCDINATTVIANRECSTCETWAAYLRFGYSDDDGDDGDGDADEHLEEKGGDSEDENGEFETDEESSEERQDFDFDDDFDGFDGYMNRNDGPNVATAPVTPPTRQTLFDLASPPPLPSTEAWSPMRVTDAELEAMIE